MPFVRALRTGYWNDTNTSTSPWGSAGLLFAPTGVDDVYSNGFNVFVSGGVITASSVTNGGGVRLWKDGPSQVATAGGTFVLTNRCTLVATISSQNTVNTQTVLLSGIDSANIVGTINGLGAARTVASVINSSQRYLTITGNLLGGASTTAGAAVISNSSSGSVTHIGNITGGTGSTAEGIRNISTGGIKVVGNVTGGTGAGAHGVNSTGIYGAVQILGSLIANSNGAYALTTGGGITRVSGNIVNASNGTSAIYAASYLVYPVPVNSFINYGSLTMYTADSFSTFSVPPESAVRVGVSYAANTLVGSSSIPPISAVSYGTSYDINGSKVGIAYNNSNVIFNTLVTTISTSNSIGERLRKAATVESTGHLVASFSN